MLGRRYNAKEAEERWQNYWIKENIYKFESDSKQPIYSIDTPPPTVNGKIHIGHIFSYSQAEIIARFKRMSGFNVFYPFGFDDNGLPTERLVEKNYKIKAKDVSREKFNVFCIKETRELEREFKNLFISAGFSCNWDYQYSTISETSRAISQHSFLELVEKGKAYHKEAPAIWCTECQTAISQAELETKEIDSVFNYIKFELADRDGYIEIATTRPELLAACCAIFVNPNDKRYQELVGKIVIVPIYHMEVPIMTDDLVDMEKGSGIVMCCTFGDLKDLEWYKKYNFEYKEAIQTDGTMSSICGKYAGLSSIDARQNILDDLKNDGKLIRQEKITHSVATHERCGTPMEIMMKKQWFIDILSEKEKFIDAGNQIEWYPSHMKMRYKNWVDNLEWDWCISRQRYYGVPFPVWYCKRCGEPIFAKKEDLPVNPLSDKPSEKCRCGCSDYIPESDILDTWATSSCSPFINISHIAKEQVASYLPMSVRPNAHDIIRTWDFYTIVKTLYHFNVIPWKALMISGHVLAGKNEKISKRKQNASLEPKDLIENFSADVVRLWAATGTLGNDIIFSEEECKNGQKLITKLWNVSRYIIMHLEGFSKTSEDGKEIILNKFQKHDNIDCNQLCIMDYWILEKAKSMSDKVYKYIEEYEIGLALQELSKFFWEFCDNYIELTKNRTYKPEIYGEDSRRSALYAMYKVHLTILKLYASYIPHITEEIYQSYYIKYEKARSIHISLFEKLDICSDREKDIIKKGDEVIKFISKIRRYKSETNISLKSELKEVRLYTPYIDFMRSAQSDIQATVNAKKVAIIQSQIEDIDIIC